MLEEFKAEVTRLVNMERKAEGAPELIPMDAVTAMAEIRAREASVLFQHTRPNGTRCFTIFTEHSLRYRAAGENLAYGYKTPGAAVDAWMKSEGHRRNNLDPDFKYIGVGSYLNEKGTIFCAVLFYTPKLGKPSI